MNMMIELVGQGERRHPDREKHVTGHKLARVIEL